MAEVIYFTKWPYKAYFTEYFISEPKFDLFLNFLMEINFIIDYFIIFIIKLYMDNLQDSHRYYPYKNMKIRPKPSLTIVINLVIDDKPEVLA